MCINCFKQIACYLLAFFIFGCSSGKDIDDKLSLLHQKLNAKIISLRKEVRELEGKVVNTNVTVDHLKTQRVVRVPTGAPTRIESREQGKTFSEEEQLLKSGVESYKSGNVKGSVDNLSLFVRQYPQSNQIDEAIYYLSQTYYNQRQYNRAKDLLSSYLKQTSKESVFVDKSQALLVKIYGATGTAPVRPAAVQSVISSAEEEIDETPDLLDIDLSTSEDSLINQEQITIDDFF